jgi:hypothetical protein
MEEHTRKVSKKRLFIKELEKPLPALAASVTTMMVGEESLKGGGGVTTLAIGEESLKS